MSNERRIRNRYNNYIGIILETDTQKKVYDKNNNFLGFYDKVQDRTFDNNSKLINYGDWSMKFLDKYL